MTLEGEGFDETHLRGLRRGRARAPRESGQAMAQAPGGSAEQAAANAAASAQSALGLAGALQGSPSNTNTAAPAVSPSSAPAVSPSSAPAASPSTAPAASPSAAPAVVPSTAGSVSQSNTVIAGSVAANGNSTSQTANQNAGGWWLRNADGRSDRRQRAVGGQFRRRCSAWRSQQEHRRPRVEPWQQRLGLAGEHRARGLARGQPQQDRADGEPVAGRRSGIGVPADRWSGRGEQAVRRLRSRRKAARGEEHEHQRSDLQLR